MHLVRCQIFVCTVQCGEQALDGHVKSGHIHLFDCDHAVYSAEQLKPYVEPFQFLVLKIIHQCKLFTEVESPNMIMSSWLIVYIKEIVSQTKTLGECGIYALKFMEMHMIQVLFFHISDRFIEMFRKKLAGELFDQDMDL